MTLSTSSSVLGIVLSSSWLLGLAPQHEPSAPSAAPEAVACSAEQLTPADWASVRAAYEANRHRAFATEVGFSARNFGQSFAADFDGRGFTVAPDGGGWTWGLELVRYGFAGDERSVPARASSSADGARVAYEWDANLTEWYVNGPSGLEHGFTLRERPGTGGELVFALAVRGGLRASISPNGRDVRFEDAHGGAVIDYDGLAVFDADGNALDARFDAAPEGLLLSIDERAARYPLTIDPIVQQAYIKASNTDAQDEFGSVALSGNTLVVGAVGEDSSATNVGGDQTDDSMLDAGAAYVFVRDGSTWSQQAYLKASNTGAGDLFGASVAISGDTIVVGAFQEDSAATGANGNGANNSAGNSGAAYVFVRTGTTWTRHSYLKASNTGGSDWFGLTVAISGDTIAVGAPNEDSNATGIGGNQSDNSATSAGAVYVFVRSGSTWIQEAYVKGPNSSQQDEFSQVALFGDTLVVGAHEDLLGGRAHVFVRNGGVWSQQAVLMASNAASTADHFGESVAISGNTVVVGALDEDSSATGVNGNEADDSAPGAGAAYVFVRSGTTWTQQAYLKASNTQAGDSFGADVAISGDAIVVTAFEEDSSAVGVNGNQADDSAPGSGAAYLFVRSGSSWSQQAYVKASNTAAGDRLFPAALSGDDLAIGVWKEDGGSSGVNGNQADEGATDSGAVYAFDLDRDPGTSSFGTGTPGCAGTQTLGVTHAPMIGSPHFAITCDNAPPSTPGLCMLSSTRNAPGTDYLGIGVLFHVDPFASLVLQFGMQSDASGNAQSVATPLPFDTDLIGLTVYVQAFWNWAGICALPPNDLSSSRGLSITVLAP